MPLYAYRCTKCGYLFEKIQHFSATPESECPKCGGVLERPLTAPALSFKGAGWYVNDYAGKSSAPAGESTAAAKKDSATTESKSDSKSSESKSSESASSAPAATPAAAPSTSSGTTTPTSAS